MEAERRQNIVSSLPILAMLAIIAGAYYVSRLPLESSRPESPLGLEQVVPEEDKIDARLWQDPLKVALDHEKAMHQEEQPKDADPRWGCRSDHCVNQVTMRINDILEKHIRKLKASIVHILLIIVRDGNFAEDHERRLRNRYAVLTALSASGLAPEDSKRFQYFRLKWTKEVELDKNISSNTVLTIAQVVDRKSRTIIVPYEWFKCMNLSTEALQQRCPDYAAVIWLPESAFSHRPLTRLAQVIDALCQTVCDTLKIDVIGPSYSDTLLAMLEEIKHRKRLEEQNKKTKVVGDNNEQDNYCHFVDANTVLCGLTIFSPWSTASPVLLMREADMNAPDSYGSPSEMFEGFTKMFKDLGINFRRTIGSDDLQALELIKELYRRGVDPFEEKHRVALISEWDTFYGKAFPLIFAAMMKHIDKGVLDWRSYTGDLKQQTSSDNNETFPANLRIYSYIRGVDGKLPQSKLPTEEKQNEQTETESKWTYTKSLELPIGRGQLDYVRRLAQEMKNECKQDKMKGECKQDELKAIGVVGSDVYDKLILLHALREEFGDATLFMTDLDARLMHYEQFKWTRNVIVASNFGLQLNEKYHSVSDMRRYLPPFRDNYQTSLFFACQMALGLPISDSKGRFRDLCQQQLAKYILHPRLFEIGRGRAIDLSVNHADIHPQTRPFPGWCTMLRLLGLISAALVFCVLLLVQINTTVRKITSNLVSKLVETIRNVWHTKGGKSNNKKKKWSLWDIITAVSLLAVVTFVIVVTVDHYRWEGEPFSLVAGISIWPGEALRLIATILSVCFLAKSMSDLRRTSRELQEDYCLQELKKSERITFTKWRMKQMESHNPNKKTTRDTPFRELAIVINRIRCWLKYCDQIGFHTSQAKKDGAEAQQLWITYLRRGTYSNRFHRLAPMSLAYIGLAFALMLILSPPEKPYRGNVSLAVDWILLFSSVGSMIILIFFVVDATKLSLNFVRNLKIPKTLWSKELVERYRESKGSYGLAEWLDIKFIATHTEAVGKLIYYPFVVLLIMFVARNRYFDNWDFPISLTTIFLLNSIMALCCGCMLRREAEKTRRMALGRLQEKLVEATGFGDESRTKQLGVMIEEIKSIRQGAYSPFTENPVLHAILIPSGGISLLTLLRFFMLS